MPARVACITRVFLFKVEHIHTQILCAKTRKHSIFFQVTLFLIHIILLLAAKRTILCRDWGDEEDTPTVDDGNYTPPTDDNPPNKCCGRIHRTCFSEHHRVRTAVHTLSLRIFFLLCAILSFWQPFLQSMILFDIVVIWPRLAVITEALFTAIPKVGQAPTFLFVDCCDYFFMSMH